MSDLKQEMMRAYLKSIINLQQYRTLVGLCDNNDEVGARKGFKKLIRRYRKENNAKAVLLNGK